MIQYDQIERKLSMTRIDGRKQDELRPVEIIPNINKFAEGSCLTVSYTHLTLPTTSRV